MRKAPSRHAPTSAYVAEALEDCYERLADMASGQERHCNGKRFGNEAHRRRGLRKFQEGHIAFLNAAFTTGEYLVRATPRADTATVQEILNEPNVKFHRELRNTVDHIERLNYLVNFELHGKVALATPKLFPHPDLSVAMSRGVVDVEAEPMRLGKGALIYDRGSLTTADAKLLDTAMKELCISENPSVLFMAERCYEQLSAFAHNPHSPVWLSLTSV